MPEKLDRCVQKVKRQKGAKNAWAICNAALNKAKKTKSKSSSKPRRKK